MFRTMTNVTGDLATATVVGSSKRGNELVARGAWILALLLIVSRYLIATPAARL